jgi:hypothetical protein
VPGQHLVGEATSGPQSGACLLEVGLDAGLPRSRQIAMRIRTRLPGSDG